MLTGRPPVAAVFEGDYPTSRAVQAVLEAHGFEVVSFSERPADVASTVRSLHADVVVLELAMAGASGLHVVRDITDRVPGCAVILLSPFDTLGGPAVAAGAVALIGTDLNGLEACLDLRRRSRPSRVTTATVSGSPDSRPTGR